MIIGIDATEFGIDRGGVRHYLFNLLQSLQEIDKDNTYRVMWTKRIYHLYIGVPPSLCFLLFMKALDFQYWKQWPPVYRLLHLLPGHCQRLLGMRGYW